MDQEQLIEFLKENLSLQIRITRQDFSEDKTVSVHLKIGEEIIAEDWDTLYAPD